MITFLVSWIVGSVCFLIGATFGHRAAIRSVPAPVDIATIRRRIVAHLYDLDDRASEVIDEIRAIEAQVKHLPE